MEASLELERKQIAPHVFINRIAYESNHICKNFDDFESVDEARAVNNNDDLLEESSDDDSTASTSTHTQALKVMPCLACLDNTSEVIMQPCGHLKVCNVCWKILRTNHDEKYAKWLQRGYGEEFKPILKCPFCNNPVDGFIEKIFV